MKTDIRELKASEITSDVFVISPTQIDFIAKTFGQNVAEAMNIRPLSEKIQQIAQETLIKVLLNARKMGE